MKRITALLLTVVMSLSVFGAVTLASEEFDADFIYINGNIYTVDEDFSVATIIATKGQKIVYVGTDDDVVEKFVDAGAECIDLNGQTVIPGIIDSHTHIFMAGDWENTIWPWRKSLVDALADVEEAADRFRAKGKWLYGMGWNQEAPGWLPDGATDWPSVADLDAIVDDIPVMLTRQCGHTTWVNTKAIEASGLDLSTPEKIAAINEELGDTGEIATDEDGNILVFVRDAANLIKRPPMTREESMGALYAFQEESLSYGVTSVMDAGLTPEEAGWYTDEYAKGDLKLRIYGELGIDKNIVKDKAALDALVKARKVDATGNYSLRAVKFFFDGSLGSGSAALLDDYSDTDIEGYRGYLINSDEDIYNIMKFSIENGFQLSAHAIGDGANRQYIDVFEKVIDDLGYEPKGHDLRPRIEHFQIVNVDDIKRTIDLDIIPSMQYIHAASDMEMAGKRVGPRIDGSYAWKTIVDLGGIIANGTDAPVEPLNPFEGLYAGVTGLSLKGTSPEAVEGFTAETAAQWKSHVLSREDALRGYTIWGAYAQYEEDVKGSLEVGKLADFVVISDDYMTVPAAQIKDLTAVATVLGGELVYGAFATAVTLPIEIEEGIKVYLDGEELEFEVPPQIYNGRTLVPLRAVFEAMGAEIDWDRETQTATATKGDTVVVLTIGDPNPTINGEVVELDQAAIIVGGRTLAPLRFVAEAFGGDVDWITETQTATITMPADSEADEDADESDADEE
jgi:predicted amidohydrolase YtcJ